jgi:hypothetical protein
MSILMGQSDEEFLRQALTVRIEYKLTEEGDDCYCVNATINGTPTTHELLNPPPEPTPKKNCGKPYLHPHDRFRHHVIAISEKALALHLKEFGCEDTISDNGYSAVIKFKPKPSRPRIRTASAT